jgi:hypothetical protein
MAHVPIPPKRYGDPEMQKPTRTDLLYSLYMSGGQMFVVFLLVVAMGAMYLYFKSNKY